MVLLSRRLQKFGNRRLSFDLLVRSIIHNGFGGRLKLRVVIPAKFLILAAFATDSAFSHLLAGRY